MPTALASNDRVARHLWRDRAVGRSAARRRRAPGLDAPVRPVLGTPVLGPPVPGPPVPAPTAPRRSQRGRAAPPPPPPGWGPPAPPSAGRSSPRPRRSAGRYPAELTRPFELPPR